MMYDVCMCACVVTTQQVRIGGGYGEFDAFIKKHGPRQLRMARTRQASASAASAAAKTGACVCVCMYVCVCVCVCV